MMFKGYNQALSRYGATVLKLVPPHLGSICETIFAASDESSAVSMLAAALGEHSFSSAAAASDFIADSTEAARCSGTRCDALEKKIF
jgi:hypothetical protein